MSAVTTSSAYPHAGGPGAGAAAMAAAAAAAATQQHQHEALRAAAQQQHQHQQQAAAQQAHQHSHGHPMHPSAVVASGSLHPGTSARFNDLVEHMRAEFEYVHRDAEQTRRDNVEYAGHAEVHVQEVTAIRRELGELEREHLRVKQIYEDKIADLRRQVETLRASQGTGPPIPNIAPATTNHFGSLMGHPQGIHAGQGGHSGIGNGSGTPGERNANSIASTSSGNALSNGQSSRMQVDERERERDRDREMRPVYRTEKEATPAQQAQRGHGMAVDVPQNLGKRARQSMIVDSDRERERDRDRDREMGYDGPPPSSKARTHMVDGRAPENGIESRTGSAAAFPPRNISGSYAHSPTAAPAQPLQPPFSRQNPQPTYGEPSVFAQQPQEAKPVVRPLAVASEESVTRPISSSSHAHTPAPQQPPITTAPQQQQQPVQVQQHPHHPQQQPLAQHQATHPVPTQAAVAPPPAVQPKKPTPPEWEVTYPKNGRRTLEVSLIHSFIHDSVVCCVRISPDGRLLATGCNRVTALYDTASGRRIAQLSDESAGPPPDNYIRSVAFSPDGTLLATGSEDKIIRIWNIATKESMQMSRKLYGHMSEIYSLAFTPKGTQLVSGSGDNTVRVWSVESGQTDLELRVDDVCYKADGSQTDTGITSIAISPDGVLLAAGALDYIVRIWDLTTGRLLENIRGHAESVYSLAFISSSDGTGRRLLTGSLDKSLKIWDLSTLRSDLSQNRLVDPTEQRSTCVQSLIGHKDFVLSVACSPDGAWAASGSKDRAVQMWDLKTGQAQFTLHGHKNSVISIAMSEQNGFLATGSGDWQAKLFKITGLSDTSAVAQSQQSGKSQPTSQIISTTPVKPDSLLNAPLADPGIGPSPKPPSGAQVLAVAAATGASAALAQIATAAAAKHSPLPAAAEPQTLQPQSVLGITPSASAPPASSPVASRSGDNGAPITDDRSATNSGRQENGDEARGDSTHRGPSAGASGANHTDGGADSGENSDGSAGPSGTAAPEVGAGQ